ncbi:Protein MAIN-LIKE 1 [Glycine soja]
MKIRVRTRELCQTLGRVLGRTLGRQKHTKLKLAFHGRKVKKFERPTLEIEGIVAATGLSSLITCSLDTGDRGLLYAFAEKWHKETSSFHLPIGEVTITLDDVASLLHLSIIGVFHTFDAPDVEQVMKLLVELLEVSIEEAKDETFQCRGTYVRLSLLQDIYRIKCIEVVEKKCTFAVT